MRVGRLISWLSSYINITAGMLCVMYQMTVSSSFLCHACTVIDSCFDQSRIFFRRQTSNIVLDAYFLILILPDEVAVIIVDTRC